MQTCAIRLCVGLAVAALPAVTAAWDVEATLHESTLPDVDFTVTQIVWNDQGGYGLRVRHHDSSEEILQIDASHQLRSRRSARTAYDPPDKSIYTQAALGRAAEDGRLYAGCGVRLAEDGSVLSTTLQSTRYVSCRRRAATPSGALWVEEHFRLGRIDPAGRYVISGDETEGLEISVSTLAATGDEGVFVLGDRMFGAVAARLDANAAIIWRQELMLQTTANCKFLTLQRRDFGVRATCQMFSSLGTEYWDLSPDGVLLDQGVLNHPFGGFQPDHFELRNTDAEVAFSRHELLRFDAERTLLWTFDLTADGAQPFRERDAYHLDSTGDLRVITESFDQDRQRNDYHWLRINQDGNLLDERRLPSASGYEQFHALPDGEFLSGNEPARWLDRNGTSLDEAPPWVAQLNSPAEPIAAVNSDSDRLLVVAVSDHSELRSYAPDGELRWAQVVDVADVGIVHRRRLASSAQAVCWRAAPRDGVAEVRCYGRQDGAPLTSFTLPEGHDAETRWLLVDDQLLALIDADRLRFLSLADGSVVYPEESLQGFGHRLVGESGSARFVLSGNSDHWAYWLDGPAPEKMALQGRGSQQLILADGVLSAISTQIPLRWQPRGEQRVVDLESDLANERILLGRDGDVLTFVQYGAGGIWLSAIDVGLGMQLWRTDLPWREDGFALFDGQALFGGMIAGTSLAYVALATPTDLELIAFGRGSGELVQQRALSCGGISCRFFTAGAASAAGIDLLIQRGLQPVEQRLLSLKLNAPSLFPERIRPVQPGIAGAWYNPAHRGQGFVLTYVPDSQTVFMPWFVYADRNGSGDDLNDESRLRWYSLQGEASAGGQAVVNLQLLRNSGGEFAQGSTAPSVVGSAQISFESCDRANLSFKFNDGVENGRFGIIPLLRLGPRTLPCDQGPLGMQPPQAGALASNGFSASQSGAWFDPASSGQGLMVEVVPKDLEQDGLLFATWFTYDLQGQGDDSQQQDWFALQGDLSSAVDGTATVTIYRSLGGVLDWRETPHLFPVGTAQLQFSGCDGLQLSYHFDDSELARRHRGIAGSQDLVRIGGCP